jgi:hypothetical protein
VSIDSIRADINLAGPTGFVWMVLAARRLPTDELRSARAAVLISWLVLGAVILIDARYTSFLYSGLTKGLLFPDSRLSSQMLRSIQYGQDRFS